MPRSLLLVAAGVACGACMAAPRETAELVVAVSVAPQAYFVDRLGGDLVAVEVMVPPGASPTTYEPTVQQMRVMSQAGLYVAVGHPAFAFESAWLDELLRDNPEVVVVPEYHGEGDDALDPHVWLAPSAVSAAVRRIADAMVLLLPAHRAAIEENLVRFLAEVDSLDSEIRKTLRGVTSGRFVVFHPAWGHFAREYGLEQVAIEAEGKEPSPGELARLVKQLETSELRVIFTQPQSSAASAELIASEVGGVVRTVDPLARDWPGAMREFAAALQETLTR